MYKETFKNSVIASELIARASNPSIIVCDSSVLTTSMYLRGMGDKEGSLERV